MKLDTIKIADIVRRGTALVFALGLALAMLAGACASKESSNAPSSTARSVSGVTASTGPVFRASFSSRQAGGANRSVFKPGETVEFAVELENISGAPQTLSFPSTQDIEVTATQAGQQVWNSSASQSYAPYPVSLAFQPADRREFSARWTLSAANGAPLAAGLYEVRARVLASNGISVPALAPVTITVQAAAPQNLSIAFEALDAAGKASSRVQAGDAFQLRLRVENRGSAPARVAIPAGRHAWDAWMDQAGGARVWQASSQWGPAPGSNWTYDIAAASKQEFSATVRAPSAPGNYVLGAEAAGAGRAPSLQLTVAQAGVASLGLSLEITDPAGQPKRAFQPGEPVHLEISVSNTGTTTETLEYNSALRYALQVRDASKLMVWDANQGLTPAPLPPGVALQETLAPGQKRVFRAVWDQSNAYTRAYVSAGTFQAHGRLDARVTTGASLQLLAPVVFTVLPATTAGWASSLTVTDLYGQPALGVKTGDRVRVELAISNRDPQPRTIQVSDGCGLAAFDVAFAGQSVRNTLFGRFCTMALVSVSFGAGETKRYTWEWDQLDNHGVQVAPGGYQVSAKVRAVGAGAPQSPTPANLYISPIVIPTPNPFPNPQPAVSDTVLITGMGLSGFLPTTLGFDVSLNNGPAVRIETSVMAMATPDMTATMLEAMLSGNNFGYIATTLASGDVILKVLPNFGSGTVRVSNASSTDPGQKIRIQ